MREAENGQNSKGSDRFLGATVWKGAAGGQAAQDLSNLHVKQVWGANRLTGVQRRCLGGLSRQ